MAEELQTYLLEHFQWLHRHPELALKEYETTNYVKNVLKQTEGVELLNLGLDTGALAKIEGKEPGGVVAIRADIDALPILEEYGKRNGMPRKRPADGSGSDPGSSKTGRKSSGNCKPKNQSDGDGSYQCDSFYIRHKLEHYPRDRQARRNRSHI